MRRKPARAVRGYAVMVRLAPAEESLVMAAAAWAGSPPSTWCRTVVLQAATRVLRRARHQVVQHREVLHAAAS